MVIDHNKIFKQVQEHLVSFRKFKAVSEKCDTCSLLDSMLAEQRATGGGEEHASYRSVRGCITTTPSNSSASSTPSLKSPHKAVSFYP
eukprot:scaffold4686_cov230-Pinguiococcus_pyrenoidosus.AAC.6